MPKENRSSGKQKKGIINLALIAIVLFLIIGIPFLLISYQAKQKGMSRSAVVKRIISRSGGKDIISGEVKDNTVGAKIDFLNPMPVVQTCI